MVDKSIPSQTGGTPLGHFWSSTATTDSNGVVITITMRNTGSGKKRIMRRAAPNDDVLPNGATSSTPTNASSHPEAPVTASGAPANAPASSAQPVDTNAEGSSNDGLPTGAIVGIVLGVLVMLGVIGFLVRYWVIRRRQKRQHKRFSSWAPSNPGVAAPELGFGASSAKAGSSTAMRAMDTSTIPDNDQRTPAGDITVISDDISRLSSVSQMLPTIDHHRLSIGSIGLEIKPPPAAVVIDSSPSTPTFTSTVDPPTAQESSPARAYLIDGPNLSTLSETVEGGLLGMDDLLMPTSPSFQFSFAEETMDSINAVLPESPKSSKPSKSSALPTSPTSTSSSDAEKDNASEKTRISLSPPENSKTTNNKTKRAPSSASVMSKQTFMFESAPMPRATLRVINRHSRDGRS